MDVQNFQSVRSVTPSLRMSLHDTFSILNSIRKFHMSLDFRLLVFTLKEQGLITTSAYCDVLEMVSRCHNSTNEQTFVYLKQIAQLITFNDLINVLRSLKLDKIANILWQERHSDPDMSIMPLKAATASEMHHHYNRLKAIICNGSFNVNRYVDFQNLTDLLISSLNSAETLKTRQQVFDNLAVVVCLRVHLYEKISEREAILEEMLHAKLNYEGLDLTCAHVVYLVSKFYIARKQNSIEQAEKYLTEAKQVCLNNENSLIKVIVFHAEHALYRKLYAVTPSENHLNKSILACDHGIACLHNERAEIQQLWRRDFQIFKALLLLCIGQEYAIDPTVCISEENRKEALEILDAAKREFPNWDNRRESMYRVCMARVFEKLNVKLAETHINMAIEASEHGLYTKDEKRNLDNYKKYLTSVL